MTQQTPKPTPTRSLIPFAILGVISACCFAAEWMWLDSLDRDFRANTARLAQCESDLAQLESSIRAIALDLAGQ